MERDLQNEVENMKMGCFLIFTVDDLKEIIIMGQVKLDPVG